jgi:hypothetical protein
MRLNLATALSTVYALYSQTGNAQTAAGTLKSTIESDRLQHVPNQIRAVFQKPLNERLCFLKSLYLPLEKIQ